MVNGHDGAVTGLPIAREFAGGAISESPGSELYQVRKRDTRMRRLRAACPDAEAEIAMSRHDGGQEHIVQEAACAASERDRPASAALAWRIIAPGWSSAR